MTTSAEFETILVALDSSESSEQIVQTLFQLQLQPTTEVVLAHVVVNTANPDIVSDRPPAEIEELPQRHIEQLQAYQSQLPCASKVEVVTGDPADEIVRLANIHQADLIVIGSRGLTGLNRVIQGSVSSQVVADAHCSVLVVKH
ncbi:universal stress protein [Oculatella sp. LEGE 06141]|uniref:universal stress protein n=1 Tax=Oculatella sp. LEGE 06141 TaxID=1828648 RepID=UPI00187FE949|nr:universal stress protein [Oculatella sp. LEGE 06141]